MTLANHLLKSRIYFMNYTAQNPQDLKNRRGNTAQCISRNTLILLRHNLPFVAERRTGVVEVRERRSARGKCVLRGRLALGGEQRGDERWKDQLVVRVYEETSVYQPTDCTA